MGGGGGREGGSAGKGRERSRGRVRADRRGERDGDEREEREGGGRIKEGRRRPSFFCNRSEGKKVKGGGWKRVCSYLTYLAEGGGDEIGGESFTALVWLFVQLPELMSS